MRKIRKVRSNHNSLFNYFIYDKEDLSKEYVNKCERFIDDLGKRKLEDCFKMEKDNEKYYRTPCNGHDSITYF